MALVLPNSFFAAVSLITTGSMRVAVPGTGSIRLRSSASLNSRPDNIGSSSARKYPAPTVSLIAGSCTRVAACGSSTIIGSLSSASTVANGGSVVRAMLENLPESFNR